MAGTVSCGRTRQGPKEAAIEVYERKLEEAEKAKEAWKEARKEARCVMKDLARYTIPSPHP